MKSITVLILAGACTLVVVASGAVFVNAQVPGCPSGYSCILVPPQPATCPQGYVCIETRTSNSVPAVSVNTLSSVSASVPANNAKQTVCDKGAAVLRMNTSSNEVAQLQTKLISTGFDIPAISQGVTTKGFFGPQTTSALIKYQKSVGLNATGIVDSSTYQQLKLADCGVQITNSATSTQPATPRVVVGGEGSTSTARITSPNGNEILQQGTLHKIQWVSPIYVRATLADIILVPYNLCPPERVCTQDTRTSYTIATGVNINQNTYMWRVGDIQTGDFSVQRTDSSYAPYYIPNGQYKIMIREAGTNNYDESDKPFTITSSSSGGVKIISPNGGEKWKSDSMQMITFDTSQFSADVKLDLYLDPDIECPKYTPGGPSFPCRSKYILDKNVTALTVYDWIVGTDINNMKIPTEGGYKLRACISGSTAECDSSDHPFTIVP